ncbi:MAG: hypothetical protein U0414_27730 [Polyangiaceae bacterium]
MTDETAMMPPSAAVQRLILEADPRRAIPLGPRVRFVDRPQALES